jgi:transposase
MVFQASLTRGEGDDMKLLYRCCAGLDIHRDTVSACIRRRVRGQAEAVIEEQVFGTFTQELERLRDWLKNHKVRQVAMESTGVYWIPIWNVLERRCWFTLTLVNPATVRALQGQKTDRIDARRIAEYLQYGLLHGSFIPPQPIRQLRELTRMRVHIQQDRNRVINRIARLLETVNIKLASVASNIVGQSGMAMLRLLAKGVRDSEQLAGYALGHLRAKIPQLVLALDGRPDVHFRWMLSELLLKLDRLGEERARIDARLDELSQPYADVVQRLSTIPGVDRTTALVLVAEFGADMSQFPTSAHLASWAGLCPGNAESAGKRLSGRTRKGDRYVRRILVQSAWAASRSKNCVLAALFFRIAQRRGMKKAAVAVAHRILVIAWHILAEQGVEYYERGGDYFDRRNPQRTARKLSQRLRNLGYNVVLTPTSAPEPAATAKRRGRPCKCGERGLPCPHPQPAKPKPKREPSAAPDPMLPATPDICTKCYRWGIPCIHVRNQKLHTRDEPSPEQTTT